jgi:hypothetical protein
MTLDGIPEHCPRHLLVMLFQEHILGPTVALSHLSQHPTHRLVDQIVGIPEEKPGDVQCRPELILLDEMIGRDNGDSPLPNVIRFG